MNDSHFHKSYIRKMITEITGIDVLVTENLAVDTLSKNQIHSIIVHFTCDTYPNLTYKVAMQQVEFNRLSESNLAEFKAYFEQIARNANEAQLH